MTTTEITQIQRLTIIKHLATGKNLDVVATITKVPRDVVLDVGSHHGYPEAEKLSWAADILAKKIDEEATADLPAGTAAPRRPTSVPAPAAPAAATPLTRPDEIRVLLNTAKSHPSKRIQNAADRVFDHLDRLRGLLREDEEKNSARRKAEAAKVAAKAEIERLERELAAAKAKLRGTPAASTTLTVDSSVSAADLRKWAKGQGIDCPATGRVPKVVREAYDDAHPAEAVA